VPVTEGGGERSGVGPALFVTQVTAMTAVLVGPLVVTPGALLFVAGYPVPRVVMTMGILLMIGALALARRIRPTWGYRPGGTALLGVTLLWVVLVPASLLSAWLDSGDDYTQLGQPSVAGCRAWVEESSFLMIGNGAVYVAGPWQPLALPSRSYVVDDGFRPASNGRYDMSWSEDGRSASVAVFGTLSDPVVSETPGPGGQCW